MLKRKVWKLRNVKWSSHNQNTIQYQINSWKEGKQITKIHACIRFTHSYCHRWSLRARKKAFTNRRHQLKGKRNIQQCEWQVKYTFSFVLTLFMIFCCQMKKKKCKKRKWKRGKKNLKRKTLTAIWHSNPNIVTTFGLTRIFFFGIVSHIFVSFLVFLILSDRVWGLNATTYFFSSFIHILPIILSQTIDFSTVAVAFRTFLFFFFYFKRDPSNLNDVRHTQQQKTK